MPVNISIKNVPDAVGQALRARAEQNHRSLQGELMAILEQAVSADAVRAPAAAARPALAAMPVLSIDALAARAEKLFPKGTASSVTFIREMRDGRYGEDWANTGRHGATD